MSLPSSVPSDAKAGSRRRQAKSELRRKHILAAATALFNERGFAATSMKDISDRVGLQKGSLYYYVPSKELLLFEILRDLHRGGEALVANIDFDTADPAGELRGFLVQIGIYAGKHQDRLKIFFRDLEYLTPEQQQLIISERQLYSRATAQLIERAKDRRQIPATLDTNVAMQMALRAVSAISDWYRPDGALTIEQVAVQVAGITVRGLTAYKPD